MLEDRCRIKFGEILKLNKKPRAGPFIIETGRTFSYIIFGLAGPLNWADQILCDTDPRFCIQFQIFNLLIVLLNSMYAHAKACRWNQKLTLTEVCLEFSPSISIP